MFSTFLTNVEILENRIRFQPLEDMLENKEYSFTIV